MVYVVTSSSINVPRIYPQSSSNEPIKLDGFPTFYSKKNEYILPVNLWFNYLANIRRSKNLNSSVRAIKRYWSFLEKNDLDWDVFPPTKFLRPTYRFRNDDLLANARIGDIQFSTASLYMLHVIKFYEWCIANHMLVVDERSKPFEYELVHVRNRGMMNHLNPNYIVTSTDLRIKVPKKSEIQSLNPLTKKEMYCSKPSGEPTYQAENKIKPRPSKVPVLGKLYAVGTNTSTVESVSSQSIPCFASSSLLRSIIIGNTTKTVPVANAVIAASPAVDNISR